MTNNILRSVNSLMLVFMRDKKIQPATRLPLMPGTLVRCLKDDSFGMITEWANNDLFSYSYATFILEPDGMGSRCIKCLGGWAWLDFDQFEKLADPTPVSLGLLEWYCDHCDDEDEEEEESEDDEDEDGEVADDETNFDSEESTDKFEGSNINGLDKTEPEDSHYVDDAYLLIQRSGVAQGADHITRAKTLGIVCPKCLVHAQAALKANQYITRVMEPQDLERFQCFHCGIKYEINQ